MDSVATLQRVVDEVTGLLGHVDDSDLGKPTPCTEWTVRDLANHIVGGATMFAVSAEGASITTIEGFTAEDGELGHVQQAFRDCHALQCGFCTPGFVTTITAFLETCDDPTEAQAREAIGGNLCRCTGYQNIVAAVLRAAELKRQEAAPA